MDLVLRGLPGTVAEREKRSSGAVQGKACAKRLGHVQGQNMLCCHCRGKVSYATVFGFPLALSTTLALVSALLRYVRA